MNPGIVEETGKVAITIVDALRSTPMSIAMILTNIMLLVFLFYSHSQFFAQRQFIYESEREVRDLLSKCLVPTKE